MTGIDDMSEEELEEELAKLTSSDSDGYGSPEPEKKDSSLKFFREIIRASESTKFGNLREKELGIVTLTPRDLFEIAWYAEAEGLDDLAEKLKERAEMVFATSLSKNGFLAQLFVTQIKKQSKVKDDKQIKKGLFGKKEVSRDE